MKERLNGAREIVTEQTRIHRSMSVWSIVAVLTLMLATTGLQAQNQPQTAQNPAQGNATAPNEAPLPTAFPTPSIPGSLQAPAAHGFDAGPFGKLNCNFLVSGMGLWQNNPVQSDNSANGALEDAKFFLEKTTSWWQFYVLDRCSRWPKDHREPAFLCC
jgi:hypothetical protein